MKSTENNCQELETMFAVSEDALFHTEDACCTLYCGRTVKPLFYRLHEVETVNRWV